MILGDFNIHVNNTSASDTVLFNNLNETFNLTQHVSDSTHTLGNTIDLLLTRSTENGVNKISICNHLISDHYAVHFSLTITRPPRPQKVVSTVCLRNFKTLDTAKFKGDILSSELAIPSANSVDQLIESYNRVLTSLLDKHAPLKTQKVTTCTLSPWFNDNITSLRCEARRAEKTWRRTGLTIHKDMFKEIKKTD